MAVRTTPRKPDTTVRHFRSRVPAMSCKKRQHTRVTILRPLDLHLHVRDNQEKDEANNKKEDKRMSSVLSFSAERFGTILLMPNLVPPITTTEMALAYKERAIKATPAGITCEILPVLYLTDNTSVEEIRKANAAGIRRVKYYPKGATTNSDSGVTDIRKVDAVLAEMQKLGMLFLVHGEVNDSDVDPFDREKVFLKRILVPLIKRLPKLRIVLEHITTKEAVEFVKKHPHIAASITAHHLLYSRQDMFRGGIRVHYFCLPVLKRKDPHQAALIEAATSGSKQFFFGSDLAPHEQHAKEASCGCGGCWSPASIELVAEVFARVDKLHNLEKFTSRNGARFHGLKLGKEKITLELNPWTVEASYPFGAGKVIPFNAGETVNWRVRGLQYPELKKTV